MNPRRPRPTSLTAALVALAASAGALVGGPAPATAATTPGEGRTVQEKARAVDLVVHRGLRSAYRGKVADENSVRSCLNAIISGADACEVDVRISRDGVPVLMHDPTTGRTTRGKGCNLSVGYYSYARLARCRLNHGDPIPRLADLARAMRPYAARKSLVVELKGRTFSSRELSRVHGDLRTYGYTGRRGNLVFESYLRANLVGSKRVSPQAPALLVSAYGPSAASIGADRLDGLVVPYSTLVRAVGRNPSYAAEFSARGLQLMSWQVNSVPALHWAVSVGATGVLTDNRSTLREAVRLRRG